MIENIDQDKIINGGIWASVLSCGVWFGFRLTALSARFTSYCTKAVSIKGQADIKSLLGIDELKKEVGNLRKEVHSVVSNKNTDNMAVRCLEDKFIETEKRLENKIEKFAEEIFIQIGRLSEKIESQNKEMPALTGAEVTKRLVEKFNSLQKNARSRKLS